MAPLQENHHTQKCAKVDGICYISSSSENSCIIYEMLHSVTLNLSRVFF